MFDAGNRLDQVAGQETYRYGGQMMYTSAARRNQNLAYLYLGNTQVATRAVAWGSGMETIRYQHTDALGSPVVETDTGGVVTKRNTYAPYGEAYGATNIDGTGYTGHVMDRATGLTYMQQRYYDPQIGRFLSVDPVETNATDATNFNRYWYGNGNPYKFSDPDGRAPKGCGDGDCKKEVSEVRVRDQKIRVSISDRLSRSEKKIISSKIKIAANRLTSAKLNKSAEHAVETMVSVTVDDSSPPSHADMNYAGTGKGGVVLKANEILRPASTPTYIASQIAHDGAHFIQGFDNSTDQISQENEEIFPLRVQRDVLEGMGAPQSEINYINTSLGNLGELVEYRNSGN